MMVANVFGNGIINRLPMALFGITHVSAKSLGEVCPKFHIPKHVLAIPS